MSTFYNDVFSLDLQTSVWNPVLLGKALQPDDTESSEDEDDEEDDEDDDSEQDAGACSAEATEFGGVEKASQSAEPEPERDSETHTDSAELDGKAIHVSTEKQVESAPSPRIGAGMVALHGEGDNPAVLVFGGMRENAKGVEEPSNDMWRLDVGGGGEGWVRLC